MTDSDSRLHDERRAAIWREAYASDSLLDVLAGLYAQEINVGMQAFWDGGWEVWFGDRDLNGIRQSEHFVAEAFPEVVGWLKLTAEQLYPVLRRHRLGVEAYV